jgi:hypothetical protein
MLANGLRTMIRAITGGTTTSTNLRAKFWASFLVQSSRNDAQSQHCYVCGAGGAGMWMEEPRDQRVNQLRVPRH